METLFVNNKQIARKAGYQSIENCQHMMTKPRLNASGEAVATCGLFRKSKDHHDAQFIYRHDDRAYNVSARIRVSCGCTLGNACHLAKSSNDSGRTTGIVLAYRDGVSHAVLVALANPLSVSLQRRQVPDMVLHARRSLCSTSFLVVQLSVRWDTTQSACN